MGTQAASSAVLFLMLLTQMGVGHKSPVCPLDLSLPAILQALDSGALCFYSVDDLQTCLDGDQIEPTSVVIKHVVQHDNQACLYVAFSLKGHPGIKTEGIASLVHMESGEWYCPAKERLFSRN